MIRLLFTLVVLPTLLFIAMLGIFRVQTPSEVAETDFGRCARPCWQDIQMGITSKTDALTRLNAVFGFEPIRPSCVIASLTSACDLYQWKTDSTRYTQIQIVDGKVGAVIAKFPGFTLGEALLTLDRHQYDLYSVNLVYNSQTAAETLYFWLWFADASIGVITEAPCPTAYYDLLQTPVDTVVVQPPDLASQRKGAVIGDLRRKFYDVCEQ